MLSRGREWRIRSNTVACMWSNFVSKNSGEIFRCKAPREKYVRAAREMKLPERLRLTIVNRDFYLQESRIDSVTRPPRSAKRPLLSIVWVILGYLISRTFQWIRLHPKGCNNYITGIKRPRFLRVNLRIELIVDWHACERISRREFTTIAIIVIQFGTNLTKSQNVYRTLN